MGPDGVSEHRIMGHYDLADLGDAAGMLDGWVGP